jgi:hypothetical protein
MGGHDFDPGVCIVGCIIQGIFNAVSVSRVWVLLWNDDGQQSERVVLLH